ncbi:MULTISPECIES: Sec-independent protein translocase subunit TatA [Streptomyces]|uniref:Sec-independent protein translocase subunit TatA n=1 Tax=Streptomyces TaxID=1883 RepID=UPI00069A7D66|nr:Sec-independent protein translocase subunit TatA [Streptomyces sp. SID7805]
MLRNGLEPWHLLIVVLVVILVFGSKKLPDTARALGKSLRILKSETKAMKDDDGPATATYSPGAEGPGEPRTIHAVPADGTAPNPRPDSGRPEPEREAKPGAPREPESRPGAPR